MRRTILFTLLTIIKFVLKYSFSKIQYFISLSISALVIKQNIIFTFSS